MNAFEKKLAEFIGVDYAVALPYRHTAMVSALKSLKIGVGDAVAVSPYVDVFTVDAICMAGATPLFIDVDKYGNITLTDFTYMVEQYPKKLRCVIAVHNAGVPCNLDGLKIISKMIVEECSYAFGAKHRGRKVGSIGDVGCFNFGELGVVTTNSFEIAENCRVGLANKDPLLKTLIGGNEDIFNRFDSYREIGERFVKHLPKYLTYYEPPHYAEPTYVKVECDFEENQIGCTRSEFLEYVDMVDISEYVDGQGFGNYVSSGYFELIYDLPQYLKYKRDCPMAEKKRENAVWIKIPETMEKTDKLLDLLNGLM